MEGSPALKMARPSDVEEQHAASTSGTHIYDLGDCLHEVARYLPLNSCLRSRLVSKTFAVAFGWAVRELMQLVSDEPRTTVRDLRCSTQVYPAVESLLLVLDKYEDMPRMQTVVEKLRLEGLQGPQGLCSLGGTSSTAAQAAGVSGTSPQGPGSGAGDGTAGLRSTRTFQRRRSARLRSAAAGGGSPAAGASPAAAAGAGDGGSGGGCGGSAGGTANDGNEEVSLGRVTRLVVRCNVSGGDMAKERQRYKEQHTRRQGAPLLQLLGVPPALLEILHDGHEVQGAAAGREGHGVRGPVNGERLLDLGFLARMTALKCLRLAVPLDLRPRVPRPWLSGPRGCPGGLAALAALRKLRRLDLLPINGITSADIEPLGELGETLEHLEIYLDDAVTLHWHRRAEGYGAPDPASLHPAGPIMLMSSRRVRDYEYATRVHPAWTRLNSLLSRLPRLASLCIIGTAPFWLPMGQYLLSEHPHITCLRLSCTSAPAEFVASPVTQADQPQQPQPQLQARASERVGQSGARAAAASRSAGRHLRVMVRHADGNTLLEDAGQLLPLQPLQSQDEVSLDICGMGSVRPILGSQIRELVAALPVRSLVIMHSTWTDSLVATEVLGALATPLPSPAPPPAGGGTDGGDAGGATAADDGGAGTEAATSSAAADSAAAVGSSSSAGATVPPVRPGLRRLQLWSRDKEAFDVSNRVLSPPDAPTVGSDGADAASVDGARATAVSNAPAGPQELVIHGLLPDTLGPLLPPSLKRLSLANRNDTQGGTGGQARRQAVVQVSCLPEGLEALDMQNISLEGTVSSRGLPRLSHLSLHSCVLADLNQLALGPRLRRLALFRNEMARSSMRRLADACPGIVELNLQEAFSPDISHNRLNMSLACAGLLADLQHIGRLSRLESLALPIPHSCAFMATMVPHLATLPSLHSLLVQGLWDLQVPALTCLTALQRLEWLKLHMVVDTRCFNLKEPPTPASELQQPQGEAAPAGGGGRRSARRQLRPQRSVPPGPQRSATAGGATSANSGQGASAPVAAARGPGAVAAPAGAAVAAGPSTEGSGLRRSTRASTRRTAVVAAAAAAADEAPGGSGAGGGGRRRTPQVPSPPSPAPTLKAGRKRVRGAPVAAVPVAAVPAGGRSAKRRRGERNALPAEIRPAPSSSSSSSSDDSDTAATTGVSTRAAAAPATRRSRGRSTTGQPPLPLQAPAAGPAAGTRGRAGGQSSTLQPRPAAIPGAAAGAGGSGSGGQPGPSTATSSLPPGPPHDARVVSRDLYESLVRNLPHTRVGMKLITITFKTEEEHDNRQRLAPAAGAGPGGLGPAGGAAAAGGGGGNGPGPVGAAGGPEPLNPGAAFAEVAAVAAAAAAMVGAAGAAAGNHAGAEAAAGGAPGGGQGPPALPPAFPVAGIPAVFAVPPDGPDEAAGDEEMEEGVEAALGDVGMLMIGFAMAALGLPPVVPIPMPGQAPGPAGAGQGQVQGQPMGVMVGFGGMGGPGAGPGPGALFAAAAGQPGHGAAGGGAGPVAAAAAAGAAGNAAPPAQGGGGGGGGGVAGGGGGEGHEPPAGAFGCQVM